MVVVWEVIHDGVSGADRSRYEELHEAVGRSTARLVIVYHLDRLARDTEGLLGELRFLAKAGVDLHVVDRGRIDITSADVKLLTTIEGAVAEHYRNLISRKTKDALALRKAQGRKYSGEPPYGFHVRDGQLVEDQHEQQALRAVRALRGARFSVRQIAVWLEANRFFARNGKSFAPSTIHKLLKGGGK